MFHLKKKTKQKTNVIKKLNHSHGEISASIFQNQWTLRCVTFSESNTIYIKVNLLEYDKMAISEEEL